jgi:hypothetical protein
MASKFRRIVMGGSGLALMGLSALIATRMSGCCGSAPTHGCKFVETMDSSAMDESADMSLTCGFQICEPGVTTCCLVEDPPNLSCIPVGQVCKGQLAACGGDRDCPAGGGLHCCAKISTQQIQCLANCPGAITDDTARVCRSDMECPPDRPLCGQIAVSGRTFFVCVPAG